LALFFPISFFLARQAEPRPRHGCQTFGINIFLTSETTAVTSLPNPRKRYPYFPEQGGTAVEDLHNQGAVHGTLDLIEQVRLRFSGKTFTIIEASEQLGFFRT